MVYLARPILFIACQPSKDTTPELSINYEKITLDNGLDVVFHVDRSDPVHRVQSKETVSLY